MLVEYIVKKMKKGLEKSVTGTTGTGPGLNLGTSGNFYVQH